MTNTKPTFFEYARQALTDVEGGYDQLAPKFENSPYVTPQSLLDRVFAKIKAKTPKVERGIDICCGTGVGSRELVQICSEEFYALDLSSGMLAKCEEKLKEFDHVKKNFIKRDVHQLGFENHFDLVVSFGAFGHILRKDHPEFVRQIFKALKPGGRFCFATTPQPTLGEIRFWRQKIFNILIHIRNIVVKPPFIMYYLSFHLPEVMKFLKEAGFEITVHENLLREEIDGKRLEDNEGYVMVEATKP